MIGLVPQEIALEPFEKVYNTVRFSRGLFGYGNDSARIEEILRKLSLWDKRKNAIKELSGGMKRRVLIAKALAHEPRILFLDELDAVAPPRGAEATDTASARVVAQLLTEIDGVEELRGVFLLGATNRVAAIDPALIRPGRFDIVLETPAPDAAVRADILAVHTRDAPLAADVDLAAWGARLEGMLGADLKAFCQSAARAAVRRHVQAGGAPEALAGRQVENKDFEAAAQAMAESAAARRLPSNKEKNA